MKIIRSSGVENVPGRRGTAIHLAGGILAALDWGEVGGWGGALTCTFDDILTKTKPNGQKVEAHSPGDRMG